MNMPLEDIRAALVSGHIYMGECPDNTTGPSSRDPECAACRALSAFDKVLAMRPLAITPEQEAASMLLSYGLTPIDGDELERNIAEAIRMAEAHGNHRALDLQYALDAEHQAHQPIRIDSGNRPDVGKRVMWYLPGLGWQIGRILAAGYAAGSVRQDNSETLGVTYYTHWLPLPPDPPTA